MDLSIIVPIYNVEQYVRACIESIYQQGLDEDRFEVILVNDGTKDKSMEVIADIIQQHKNITVINQENQGLSMARNNGMAIAKGEYLLMLDSDDLLIENSVKPLLEKALETKADMIVADFVEMNDEGIKKHSHFQILQGNNKPDFAVKTGEELLFERVVWRTLYRKDFISDNHFSFYPGITFEDNPFTLKCYLKAKLCIRAHWLLNIYRIGNTTISSPSTFNKKKNWSFLPDEEISSLQLKAYEFMRDVYLFFQHFRRPELNVRGMVFAFKTDLARKYGFRNDIIRGEDGSLALNLKQDGKIRFVRSRKVRSVTSNSILKVQGTSLWDEVVHRGKKGAMGLTGLLVSKRQYEDKVDNLIKN